ncbi:MAG: hypothetical protein V3T70_11330 [Phycisphaerae bacterium]
MKRVRWFRMRRLTLVFTAAVVASPVGCINSTWFKRFREAYSEGLVEGFSAAVTDPANSEVGLRRALAALFEGLGAIIETRDTGN